MRKLTKKLAALALGVVTVASLTACGGSSKGITIAVPNDTTNEARALLLLEESSYIKLKDGVARSLPRMPWQAPPLP